MGTKTFPIIGTTRRRDSRDDWAYAGHFDPGFTDAAFSELDRLSRLRANWDGYQAPPIRSDIIDAAKMFISELPLNLAYRPRVVPMSPGNLQFEWHNGDKVLELEFESPSLIRFLQWEPSTGTEEEGTISARDIDGASDLIRWFMNGTSCA